METNKPIISIEKVDDSSYERIIRKPEQIIPEEIIRIPVTLEQAETELTVCLAEIATKESSRAFDVEQYEEALAKHDAILAPLYEKRDALQKEISDAKDMGVKIEEKPIEELEPADMMKNVPLQEEVISN